ncbi:MAG TPA: hypothetical protein VOB72_01355 [Candidatus Dormibacteraeota bacterium]|nr:hypothetical protein [Candidatus Dormibacteraeota bacterium]
MSELHGRRRSRAIGQNLPIGAVTSPHAVRVRRLPARLPRMRLHVVLTLVGVAAAAAGAVVSALPGPVTVRSSADAYEIGGTRLTAVSPGVYEGSDGAAVVLSHGSGVTRAGASAGLGGAHMTGTCVLADGARTESCRFTLGGRPVSAEDTWTGGGWHRRYDDGRSVDISVAGGRQVPVPIAVGR